MPLPAFPTFTNGVVSGIDGYAEADLLYSTVETLDSGYGNSYAWNSYYDPTTKIFHNFQEERFSIAFPMFTQAEVATLEAFWVSMGGPYGYFTFTDDQGITWPKCQFDQETLEFQYLGPNQYSVECKILAVTQTVIPPRPLPNPPPPAPPPPPPITGLSLTVLTTLSQPTSAETAAGYISATAFITPAGGGVTWLGGLASGGAWTLQTNTFTILGTVPSVLTGITITFQLSASLNGLSDVHLQIYDCVAHVTYAGGSTALIRPAAVSVHQDAAYLIPVTNPANAIDADPTSFSDMHRIESHSLYTDDSIVTVTWA